VEFVCVCVCERECARACIDDENRVWTQPVSLSLPSLATTRTLSARKGAASDDQSDDGGERGLAGDEERQMVLFIERELELKASRACSGAQRARRCVVTGAMCLSRFLWERCMCVEETVLVIQMLV
jgi:hypothetical protein